MVTAIHCQELADILPYLAWGPRGLDLSENNQAGILNLLGKAIRAAIAEPRSPLVQVAVRTLAVLAEPSLQLVSVDTVVSRKELKNFLGIAAKTSILDEKTATSLFRITHYSQCPEVHEFCKSLIGKELAAEISRVIAKDDHNTELLGNVEAAITWAILYGAVNPKELEAPLERRSRYVNSLEQLDATAFLSAAIALAGDSLRKLREIEDRLFGVLKPNKYDAGFLSRPSDNPLTALKATLRAIPELLPRGGSEMLLEFKASLGVCGNPSHSRAKLSETVRILREGALPALFPRLRQCDLYAIAKSLAIGSPVFQETAVRCNAAAFGLDRMADRAQLHLTHGAHISADLLLEHSLTAMDAGRCGPEEERAYLRLLALRIGNPIHSPADIAKLTRDHFEKIENTNAGLRVRNHLFARSVLGGTLDRVEVALGDPQVSADTAADVEYLAKTHLKLLQPASDTPMSTVSFFYAQRMSTRLVDLFFQLHRSQNLKAGKQVLEAIYREIEQFETQLDDGDISWSVADAFVNCVNRFEQIAHFAHTDRHRHVVSCIRIPLERVANKFEHYARTHEPSEDHQGRLLGVVIGCRNKLSSEVLNP
jgi:hypothetical protein